jgi:hypothetical protein
MDPLVDIEQLVLALLQKRKRDYLTVKQIVAGLPSAPRKRLALSTRCPFHKSCASLDPLKIKGFRALATSKSGSEFTKWTSSQRQLTTGVKEHEQTIVALERV